MSVLAVIPARGASKGIPGKNLRTVGGVPLIAQSVRIAAAASTVDRVVVSTDDSAIADMARAHGAEIIGRPAEISGDTASSESALFHALDHLLETEGYNPDVVMLIQCTAPFTTTEDIEGVVAALDAQNADSAFAVAPFRQFVWSQDADGAARGVNHDGKVRQRRQDLAPEFVEVGSAYAMRVPAFRRERTRFCGRTVLYCIDAKRCFDIDEPDDLVIADFLASEFLNPVKES